MVRELSISIGEANKLRRNPNNPFYARKIIRHRSTDLVQLPDFTNVFENSETSQAGSGHDIREQISQW